MLDYHYWLAICVGIVCVANIAEYAISRYIDTHDNTDLRHKGEELSKNTTTDIKWEDLLS